MPAGKNDVTVDVTEMVEEMRIELPKYKTITLLCTLKNVKGASLGTIDQIILNNAGDMSEEDMKALQEALSEMFDNMEEKSGGTDVSGDAANTLQAGSPKTQCTREQAVLIAVRVYEAYK
jgi:carbamoylphosphate synthase large subunit